MFTTGHLYDIVIPASIIKNVVKNYASMIIHHISSFSPSCHHNFLTMADLYLRCTIFRVLGSEEKAGMNLYLWSVSIHIFYFTSLRISGIYFVFILCNLWDLRKTLPLVRCHLNSWHIFNSNFKKIIFQIQEAIILLLQLPD